MELEKDEIEVEDPEGRTETGTGCIGITGVAGVEETTGRETELILGPCPPLPLPLPFDPREEIPLGIRGVSGRVTPAVGEFLLALRGDGEPPRLLLLLIERCKNWSRYVIQKIFDLQ